MLLLQTLVNVCFTLNCHHYDSVSFKDCELNSLREREDKTLVGLHENTELKKKKQTETVDIGYI